MQACTVRVRLLLGGAALAACMLPACSSDGTNSTPLNSSGGATPTVPMTVGSASSTSAPVAPVAPASTVAPLTQLQLAVDAIAASHHFHAVVTVNGVESLVADGDAIGASARLTLIGSDVNVAQIVTPDGSYAQPEGGDWSLLTEPPATTDPIAALRTPTTVTVASDDGVTTVLAVSVNARSLGISIDGDVPVTVTLVDGAISRIDYSAPVEGGTAQVATTFGPVADATPIVAPI